jgi:hypothetical protein
MLLERTKGTGPSRIALGLTAVLVCTHHRSVFPGYPSNHGTASAAAAEVLERVYGSSGHDVTFSNAALPGVVLHYTEFKRIVQDVHDARVYGGIHFRFDQETGGRQGERIGEYIYKYRLQVIHP